VRELTVRELTVRELVADQVARAPDEVALRCGGVSLTYRELDERADRLAWWLAGRGVGPESLVGIALPRSAELVVALLAVAKAGAGYLPVDPRYPASRIEFMLADARPRLVLATAKTETDLVALGVAHGVECIRLEDIIPPDRPPSGPAARVLPGHMAYLMYTSGSTGEPKGVVITQAAVASTAPRLAEIAGLGQGTVMLAGTSINFDVSVFEIFATLSAGGTVEILRDALELAERPEPTPGVISAVPSVLAELLARTPASVIADTIVLAGEGLPASLVGKIRHTCPTARVINAYGQTETLYATAHPVPDGPPGTGTVPIGTPLAHMRTYILGPDLWPVPPGVTGELYVGGLIGRGYHNQARLTAHRFVADPCGPPGQRMYRTGDLARHSASGHIEYAGRADHQLKIRGIRVEPAEIETALTTHPGIKQAAVTAHGSRLAAYVVPARADSDLDPRALRRFLSGLLPGHLIPSTFQTLDRLPLGPTGKLDRAALPEPPQRSGRGHRAPRTEREATVAALVAEVLGQDLIGIDDDIAALGGNGLHAASLADRVRAKLGIDLPLPVLVGARTVAEITDYMVAHPQPAADLSGR
jgi:amino acid adenylation domain-containing protein